MEVQMPKIEHPLPRDYKTTELAPELLCTPFQVRTNWRVITGAPSCGKTTLIEQLASHGLRTVGETAREYLEREVAKGRAIAEIRSDMATVEREIVGLQRQVEEGLSARELVFFDRGLPDCLAFFRLAGVDPNAFLAECFHHRYASVFLLDPLPFELDGTRMEGDAAIAAYLAEWHARDYRALGYAITRVPVLPPQERLAFVLERASQF
jgi:predicted ATPase